MEKRSSTTNAGVTGLPWGRSLKYALFFLFIAAQFFVEAALLGGYFWVLAWPGFSFGLVALAYLGLGPGVFGKQASGSLAWWSVLLLLPYLLLAWITWHLVRRMSREDCYNEVAPGIFVSRRPLPGELPSLHRLPARLLRTIRFDNETPLSIGWQGNSRLINRRGD